MKTKIQNPQAWLPVGQYVVVPSNLYRPVIHTVSGKKFACGGRIVEHLAHGGVCVLFDSYPNKTDYGSKDAAQFIVAH